MWENTCLCAALVRVSGERTLSGPGCRISTTTCTADAVDLHGVWAGGEEEAEVSCSHGACLTCRCMHSPWISPDLCHMSAPGLLLHEAACASSWRRSMAFCEGLGRARHPHKPPALTEASKQGACLGGHSGDG